MSDDQLSLFDVVDTVARSSSHGFRIPAVQATTGVTYRQLDYWARTHVVEPSIQAAAGSGTKRLYSFTDIVHVKIVKRLLDTGISLQSIRRALDILRARGDDAEALSAITLVGDGTTIYECTDDGDVIDLLAGGQCVFGIAIKRTVEEVRGQIAQFPAEAGAATSAAATEDVVLGDELALRRARRAG
ncbi:MerR family transcriptional regulator [Gordonia malaquae]|uniref:MerR family transcriptional regulator n=1 Tax=Gordonia malaquae TaxID=410332 RepID=UPI003AFAC7DA